MNPSIAPAMIDSHGKPGIAGSVIGVVTAIELVVPLVVGVLVTVITEREVLMTVVVIELVTDWVDVLEKYVLVSASGDVELSVVTLGGAEVDDTEVASVAVTPPGGSRWNIIPREATPPIVAPTANPFVPDLRKMLFKRPMLLAGIGMYTSVTVFQAVPSQCRKTGNLLTISWPTAQPSVEESTTIDVRLSFDATNVGVIVFVCPFIVKITPLLPLIHTTLLSSNSADTEFN